ncbi:MAG: AAA family ATPase [Pseudonocardia sp.]
MARPQCSPPTATYDSEEVWMAWVKSVSVAGLAGRPGTVVLAFDRHVNVLWGVNGCGKTSLLKIIHSALRDDAKSLVRAQFDSAEVSFVDDLSGTAYRRRLTRHGASRQETEQQEMFESSEDGSEYVETLIDESKKERWVTTPKSTRRIPVYAHRHLPISRLSAETRGGYASYYSERSGIVDEALFDKWFATDLQRLWR